MIATVLIALGVLGDPQPAAASPLEAPKRPGSSEEVRDLLVESARGKEAGIADIERTGLSRDPSRCRTLVRRLQDDDPEIRSAAARALGWCDEKDAVDPIIASLGRFGWNETAEAALLRLDPSWRTRSAARRTFDEVHERWWKALQQGGASHQAEDCESRDVRADVLGDLEEVRLLVALDEARARAALLERLTLPAGPYGCSLWAIGDKGDATFAADLERALASAPDRACLSEAATILERTRPGWRKSSAALAAADIYAGLLATGSKNAATDACIALTILGDDRGWKCDRNGEGLQSRIGLAREGDREAIAYLKKCALGMDPHRSGECVRALGELGSADLVDTYRAILAEPRPPAREDADGREAAPAAEPESPEEPSPDRFDFTARETEPAAPDMRRYYWAARRAAAVTGLAAAAGAAALHELRTIVADTEQPDEVLSAIAAAAKGHTGTEWVDLLLGIASRDDADRARGEAIAALLDQGHVEALPLLWEGIREHSLEAWQREELVATAVRLAPEETIERLRALAAGDPDLYPVLASALLEPPAAASAQDLVGLLRLLTREEAASSESPATRPAHSEAKWAATDVLQRLADGPPLDRSLAATMTRFVDDPDPHVRALASYVLWRAESGH